MILESKIVFSKNFLGILSKMGSNEVAKELVKLYNKDIDGVQHNYILLMKKTPLVLLR
jgi:hypothetical protein